MTESLRFAKGSAARKLRAAHACRRGRLDPAQLISPSKTRLNRFFACNDRGLRPIAIRFRADLRRYASRRFRAWRMFHVKHRGVETNGGVFFSTSQGRKRMRLRRPSGARVVCPLAALRAPAPRGLPHRSPAAPEPGGRASERPPLAAHGEGGGALWVQSNSSQTPGGRSHGSSSGGSSAGLAVP